eukprot:g7203.t1
MFPPTFTPHSTPVCVVKLRQAERNAAQMLYRAKRLGVKFRPHVKTHKTVEGALLQTGGEKGSGIIVSTLAECVFYLSNGFDDIIYGVPLGAPNRIPEIFDYVVKRRKKVHVLLDCLQQLDVLEEKWAVLMAGYLAAASGGDESQSQFSAPPVQLSVYIMVGGGRGGGVNDNDQHQDVEEIKAKPTGPGHSLRMHQAGLDPASPDALSLAQRVSSSEFFDLAGLYIHAAHAYECSSKQACLASTFAEASAAVEFAKRVYDGCGVRLREITIGSTPSMSFDLPDDARRAANDDLEEVEDSFLPTARSADGNEVFRVTELHAGNYLFYDQMQADLIQSCRFTQIACVVRAQIVSVYENKLLMDLGWTGISAQGADTGYGRILSHPELRIASLKQETGELVLRDEQDEDFSLKDRYPVGTIVEIAPFHSCAACHQYTKLLVEDEDRAGAIVGTWERCAAR